MDGRRNGLGPTENSGYIESLQPRLILDAPFMKDLVSNYAIVRFMPYKETGEFVNLGVVMTCAQTNLFAFRVETRRQKRVTDFFPELEISVFKAGLDAFMQDLTRISTSFANSA